ncbi:protein TolR [Aliidiomarina quisquiliarum]|uniref:protein TolR n=1 Tax=Aliidiomarina quisquiliarum TaxID=2938947 RepID=UPI00208FCC67|nr:protein TolR [Aliidiomarina quisquiliarum]MCO4321978.1 protein TolR [Aliidiomarina quisquiliarum]
MSEAFVTRRKRKPMSEINVVPYIDVMLVLLIIFMVTSGLLAQGVEVELPQGEAAPLSEDKPTPLVASVDKDGIYYLSEDGKPDKPMSVVDLTVAVAAHMQMNKDTPVVVRGDKSVEYGKVVNLMVLLQGAGVPSVGLMTEPPES